MKLDSIQKNKYGFALIFFTWFVFFLPIVSGKYVYFLDDLKIIYYPLETLYAQFQYNWQLPLWANEFGFGQPLLAWGQLGFFTPLHIILRAFFIPPLALLQISIAAYFLVGSIGMFLFLIQRNFNQYAASLGAIIFAYCGFSIGHLNHVNFYTSTMLLPYLLLAIYALVKKPTIVRTMTLALVASAITLSGQPQVILYVFIVAASIALGLFLERPSVKAIELTIAAAILALLLSSFAILPLKEFLPETERAAGLPQEELFEFSYPPWHSITLILPYFFGDHENYWGAKGFQELAAYTGIIPLILAGGALTYWKQHRAERITGLVLLLGGIMLALGKYSPLYTYLIERHYITSIGVAGRFVFFFDMGVVLLAAVGLHDLTARRKLFFLGYMLPVVLIAIPLAIAIQAIPEIEERFQELWIYKNISWWLIGAGAGIVPLSTYFKKLWLVPILAASTLVFYGLGYIPRTSVSEAYALSPFVDDLMAYKETHGYPARIYAAERLPITGNPQAEIKLSEPISPLFSVFQPISQERKEFDCIIVLIQADSPEITHLTITIRTGFNGTIWHSQQLSSEDAFKNPYQQVCFPEVLEQERENLMVSFSSSEQTNMKVFISPSKSDTANLYFVRVQQPTEKQLAASKKPLSVQYIPDFPRTEDSESALLIRHIQAVAGASSARWIGALSIRSYREFIDSFFANDSEAFDGDGTHALNRNKKLVDFVGITHFAQSLTYEQTNDPMIEAGYNLVQEADTGESVTRLYSNPSTFPKAFLVPNAEFIAADDEIRHRLRNPNYDPFSLVYISGPTPPQLLSTYASELTGSATIIAYKQTRVEINVATNHDAILVLADATTPEWQTFIDGEISLPLKANTMFKAAHVPAGNHTVVFQYISPAVQKAKILTMIGLTVTVLGYAYGYKK